MLDLARPSASQGAANKPSAGAGVWGKMASTLVLACLMVLPAVGALANTVPVGGSGTFPPTSTTTPTNAWAIYNPGGTLIADQGNPVPGPSGWNVTFQTVTVGGVTSISSITVTAPGTAILGNGYKVVVAGPPGNNTALFDVIAGSNAVPTGGSGTFPPTSNNPVYWAWGIFDPQHVLIAAGGGVPNPGSNGWNVSFTTIFSGGVTSISSITVTAPSTAGIGPGYSVVVAGPPGNNTASFDVVASGSVPNQYGVNSLVISPTSIRGGDTATGTVSINSIAPAGGIVVSTSSSSTTFPNYALVPSSVTVSQGRSLATFSIPTLGSTSATITATGGGQTQTGFISVSSSPPSGGNVRVGQSATFSPTAFRSPVAGWAITGPAGTIIASSGGPAPPNGWNVTFGTYFNGQFTSISSITVSAPAGAMIASNYSVCVAGPSGNNVANFTVTP